MFSRTKDFRILPHVFRGPGFFWALAYVFRGPNVLDPDTCFQRPWIFGSCLMFLEDRGFFGPSQMFSEEQRSWMLAHVYKGLGFLDFGSCFQRTKGFLGLAHVFRGSKVLDPSSCI